MGSTARFIIEQNIRRFAAKLQTEPDPENRRRLKQLLLEQAHNLESADERRSVLRRCLEECEAELSRQEGAIQRDAAKDGDSSFRQQRANLEEMRAALRQIDDFP